MRTTYKVSMVFNECKIEEVIIDQHYKINHSEMTDYVILGLVKALNGLTLNPTSKMLIIHITQKS